MIILIAQLSGHRPKDTRAPRVLIFFDDDGCILVKTDVGAVVTAYAGSGADNNRLHNVALFNLRRRVLLF